MERFIPDPFSTVAQGRLYKTGDLGRWRSDGTIEYLGRNDHQVKIRGFRIELGEIEAQLRRHAQVKKAMVLAREDTGGSGEKRLVAYMVAQGSQTAPSVEKLREHLQEVLPEHMIPGAFVVLEQLPLTPNGKLDRRALPAPDVGVYVSRHYEAPLGEVEEILAGIWQGLLQVEPGQGSDERASAKILQEHLRERLPDYMLPSAYVWLESLPLTANRKLNRRALPVPAQSVPRRAMPHALPHNAREWQSVSTSLSVPSSPSPPIPLSWTAQMSFTADSCFMTCCLMTSRAHTNRGAGRCFPAAPQERVM